MTWLHPLQSIPQKHPALVEGAKFGRWTVLRYSHKSSWKPMYACVCECGTEKFVAGYKLITGQSKSCGCLQKKLSGVAQISGGAG